MSNFLSEIHNLKNAIFLITATPPRLLKNQPKKGWFFVECGISVVD